MAMVKINKLLNKNMEIYRFMSFPMLMTLIELKKMPLKKLLLWDDTYEVPLKFFITDEERKMRKFNYYGACWTISHDSDAMWRIYSPDMQGVCIQTTVEKISTLFEDSDNDRTQGRISAELSPVQYGDIETLIEDEKKSGTLFYKGYTWPYLYLKRNAFEHENEIRLVVKYDSPSLPDHIFITNINPNSIIEKVIFDPRVADWYYSTMCSYLNRHDIKSEVSRLYGSRL